MATILLWTVYILTCTVTCLGQGIEPDLTLVQIANLESDEESYDAQSRPRKAIGGHLVSAKLVAPRPEKVNVKIPPETIKGFDQVNLEPKLTGRKIEKIDPKPIDVKNDPLPSSPPVKSQVAIKGQEESNKSKIEKLKIECTQYKEHSGITPEIIGPPDSDHEMSPMRLPVALSLTIPRACLDLAVAEEAEKKRKFQKSRRKFRKHNRRKKNWNQIWAETKRNQRKVDDDDFYKTSMENFRKRRERLKKMKARAEKGFKDSTEEELEQSIQGRSVSQPLTSNQTNSPSRPPPPNPILKRYEHVKSFKSSPPRKLRFKDYHEVDYSEETIPLKAQPKEGRSLQMSMETTGDDKNSGESPPVKILTNHVHRKKTHRVIELGSSESIEIVRKKSRKPKPTVKSIQPRKLVPVPVKKVNPTKKTTKRPPIKTTTKHGLLLPSNVFAIVPVFKTDEIDGKHLKNLGNSTPQSIKSQVKLFCT